MTYDEALREIGAAPGSSPEEIRRAYLRGVKVRKPESDPEGFRRLREAYELLRHLPEASPEIRLHPRPAAERPAGPEEADPEETAPVEAGAGAEDDLPHPRLVIRMILQLQAEGQAAEAERVQKRFQRRLGESSRELSLLDDQTAALWQIAREISGLSADFPPPVRVAISSAVLKSAPDLAIPRLLSQVGEDGDAGWRMASEIKDLPGLGSLYHDVLIDALRNRSWARRALVAKPSWSPQRAFGILIGLCCLAQVGASLFRPSPSPPAQFLPYPAPPSVPAREEKQTVCPPGPLRPWGQTVFCKVVQTAFDHLSQRRCHEVREAREQILAGLQGMRGSDVEKPAQDLFDSLRAEYITICQDYSF